MHHRIKAGLLIGMSTVVTPTFAELTSDQLHQSAIQMFRTGETSNAVPLLQNLVAQFPDTMRYRYDYIYGLSKSGEHHAALQQSKNLDMNEVPPYVLETLAESALYTGKNEVAKQAYDSVLQRHPHRVTALLGLSNLYIKQKDFEQARSILLPLEQLYPDNKAVLQALMSVSEQDKQQRDASKAYSAAITQAAPVRQTKDMASRHEQAKQLIRSGDFNTALPILQQLMEESPNEVRYRNDYLYALCANGDNQQAVSLAADLRLDSLPPYLLEALAKSHRNLQQFLQAQTIYQAIAKRYPDRLVAEVGVALALVDQQKVDDALEILLPLESKHPEDRDVQEALIYAYETDRDPIKALTYLDKALKQRPENADLLRKKILLTNQMGLPHLALSLASSHASVLNNRDWARLRSDAASYEVRWGKAYVKNPDERHVDTDKAIARLHDNIDHFQQEKLDPYWENLARYDLIAALSNREEVQKILSQLESLNVDKEKLPDYVSSAVANAYLTLHQPQLAQQWYSAALQQSPNNFDSQVGLFYAYLDANQYDRALEWADMMVEKQPKLKTHWDAENKRVLKKPNPNKTSAEITAAMARAFTNDLPEAENRLSQLIEQAPYNATLRESMATVYNWRGWPRRALDEAELGLVNHPDNTRLKQARINALYALNRYQEGDQALAGLLSENPDDRSLKRMQKERRIQQGPELQVSVNGGHNSGSTYGTQEAGVETYLYSQPLADHFRVFGHYLWNKAKFQSGTAKTRRAGGGLEFKGEALTLTSEVHFNDFAKEKVGVSVGADYQINDYWSIYGKGESLSAGTPYRALANGLDAWSLEGSVSYRPHERQSYGVGGMYLNFSDTDQFQKDNQQYSLFAKTKHRWISGPRFNFDTTLRTDYTHNTDSNGPYFAPEHGVSITGSMEGDYLTWSDYDKKFYQHLELTTGGFWQGGDAQDLPLMSPIGAISYAHRWNLVQRLELTYGARWASLVFDGTREQNWDYYAHMNWKF